MPMLKAMFCLAAAAARYQAEADAKDRLAWHVASLGGDPSIETRLAQRARRKARLCALRYDQLAARY